MYTVQRLPAGSAVFAQNRPHYAPYVLCRKLAQSLEEENAVIACASNPSRWSDFALRYLQ
jgi:hypothetical protein